MISLNKVSKIYNQNAPALNNISFRVEAGEFVSIVGQSGTGKTTLIKLLIAEEAPTNGEINIGGWKVHNIKKRDIPFLRRQIGVIFQDFKLLPKKTVAENVAFALEVSGEKTNRIREVVPKVLDIVGLKSKMDRYPSEISGGEQQRVVIARSLVHRPKILVADEPTGNLDAVNTEEIIEILKKINEFGTTIILVTHNKDVVNNLHRRVLTLHNGALVLDQTAGKYRLQ